MSVHNIYNRFLNRIFTDHDLQHMYHRLGDIRFQGSRALHCFIANIVLHCFETVDFTVKPLFSLTHESLLIAISYPNRFGRKTTRNPSTRKSRRLQSAHDAFLCVRIRPLPVMSYPANCSATPKAAAMRRNSFAAPHQNCWMTSCRAC